MNATQIIILTIKGHAFDVIHDILADCFESCDEKKSTAYTLFEINGAIVMANRMIQAVKLTDEGSEDE